MLTEDAGLRIQLGLDDIQLSHEVDYPTRQVDDDIGSWARLHRFFGLALSERIVKDAAGWAF